MDIPKLTLEVLVSDAARGVDTEARVWVEATEAPKRVYTGHRTAHGTTLATAGSTVAWADGTRDYTHLDRAQVWEAVETYLEALLRYQVQRQRAAGEIAQSMPMGAVVLPRGR